MHDAYTQLAHSGQTSDEHRQRFIALADTLHNGTASKRIVLAGTDFALMFNAANTPFPHVDCTRAHIDSIMQTTP